MTSSRNIKIREVKAYQTSDKRVFDSYLQAFNHQADLIGELLDDLIPVDARGRITRSDQLKQIETIINRPDLKDKIDKLHYMLSYTDEDEDEYNE